VLREIGPSVDRGVVFIPYLDKLRIVLHETLEVA